MSHTLTETASWDAITVPDEGDDASAASIADAAARSVRVLANRTQGLRRLGAVSAFPVMTPIASWQCNGNYFYTLANTAAYLYFPLDLPIGSTLSSARIYLGGSAGHSWPIQYPPYATVERVNLFTGQSSAIASNVADPSANAAEYQAYHSIYVLLSSPTTIEYNTRYYLLFRSEYGTNSLANLLVYGVVLE
jgi:hypothetical protein